MEAARRVRLHELEGRGPVEAFDFDVSPLVGPGNHLVAVRVFDQAGNFVVRDIEVK